MNWRDLLSIRITDNCGVVLEVGLVFVILALLAVAVWAAYRFRFRRRLIEWSWVEANVQLGGIGSIRIRPSYENIQIAHKAWIELVTRKAALPFDEDHDVIVEIYDSWYTLFQEMRNLAKAIPAEKVRDSAGTRELVRLLVDALNQGLRPHLTQWQARFRHWYDAEIQNAVGRSPQDVQRDYPQYQELVDDLIKVNKELVEYADVIKEIAHGKPKN